MCIKFTYLPCIFIPYLSHFSVLASFENEQQITFNMALALSLLNFFCGFISIYSYEVKRLTTFDSKCSIHQQLPEMHEVYHRWRLLSHKGSLCLLSSVDAAITVCREIDSNGTCQKYDQMHKSNKTKISNLEIQTAQIAERAKVYTRAFCLSTAPHLGSFVASPSPHKILPALSIWHFPS